MPQFVLIFDRKSYATGTLVVEAKNLDDAYERWRLGDWEALIEEIRWQPPDDVEINLVKVATPAGDAAQDDGFSVGSRR